MDLKTLRESDETVTIFPGAKRPADNGVFRDKRAFWRRGLARYKKILLSA